eukprot:355627-Chlamydomonas_euryale.AAC.22
MAVACPLLLHAAALGTRGRVCRNRPAHRRRIGAGERGPQAKAGGDDTAPMAARRRERPAGPAGVGEAVGAQWTRCLHDGGLSGRQRRIGRLGVGTATAAGAVRGVRRAQLGAGSGTRSVRRSRANVSRPDGSLCSAGGETASRREWRSTARTSCGSWGRFLAPEGATQGRIETGHDNGGQSSCGNMKHEREVSKRDCSTVKQAGDCDARRPSAARRPGAAGVVAARGADTSGDEHMQLARGTPAAASRMSMLMDVLSGQASAKIIWRGRPA